MIWLMASTLFFVSISEVDDSLVLTSSFYFDPVLRKILHLTSIYTSKRASNHRPVDRSSSNLSSLLSAIQACWQRKNNSTFGPRIQDTSHVGRHRGLKRPTPQRYLARIRKAGWGFNWGAPAGSCG